MTIKLVYLLLLFALSSYGNPYYQKHSPHELDGPKSQQNLTAKANPSTVFRSDPPKWTPVPARRELQKTQRSENFERMRADYGDVVEKPECTGFEAAWYYMFPFILYFLLILAALGLFLIVVHVTLCIRKFLCPLIPLDVRFCHRTTVTEEKAGECKKKDKLQLSLVNVNKHYYKLEGHDGP